MACCGGFVSFFIEPCARVELLTVVGDCEAWILHPGAVRWIFHKRVAMRPARIADSVQHLQSLSPSETISLTRYA